MGTDKEKTKGGFCLLVFLFVKSVSSVVDFFISPLHLGVDLDTQNDG